MENQNHTWFPLPGTFHCLRGRRFKYFSPLESASYFQRGIVKDQPDPSLVPRAIMKQHNHIAVTRSTKNSCSLLTQCSFGPRSIHTQILYDNLHSKQSVCHHHRQLSRHYPVVKCYKRSSFVHHKSNINLELRRGSRSSGRSRDSSCSRSYGHLISLPQQLGQRVEKLRDFLCKEIALN